MNDSHTGFYIFKRPRIHLSNGRFMFPFCPSHRARASPRMPATPARLMATAPVAAEAPAVEVLEPEEADSAALDELPLVVDPVVVPVEVAVVVSEVEVAMMRGVDEGSRLPLVYGEKGMSLPSAVTMPVISLM